MKKNTILYGLLVVLLVTNCFFLFKHFSERHGHRGNNQKGKKDFLVRQLDFSESQLSQFNELKTEHRNAIKEYNDAIRNLKDDFFSHLSDESVLPGTVDSIATLISQKEKMKDIETYSYFKEVRQLCSKEQKEKFSSIIKDAIHKRNRRGPNGPPKRGDRPPKRN